MERRFKLFSLTPILWTMFVSLLAKCDCFGVAILRGPYLQNGSPTELTIRWRTDQATDSHVRYGTVLGALNLVAHNPSLVQDHEVRLTGLAPNTKYYYTVGNRNEDLAVESPDLFFQTSPNVGSNMPVRIWVLGDSGTANSNARAVRDAYLELANTEGKAADLWLMLGDNAYNDGNDSQYQKAVFDMYPSVLRNKVLWSTIGNHDARTSKRYFEIFTLPSGGEAGGIASSSENYYSFDYANIHFICLDSHISKRNPNGPMLTWLVDDIANTNQAWVIAFWHHPPYSKGSHNSDRETRLVEMRENALPILEAGGVDLVLSGHSHSYERSIFLNGHYGKSSTYNSSVHAVDSGNGREDDDGAYNKMIGNDQNNGAVYIVAGSSGQVSSASLNHPVMYYSVSNLGSLVIDVENNRLDVRFLREKTNPIQVDDFFTIIKNHPPVCTTTNFVVESGQKFQGQLNATDEDGNGITFSIETNPSNGTFELNEDGSFIYQSNTGFIGEDTFGFTVTDDRGARAQNACAGIITVNPKDLVVADVSPGIVNGTNTAVIVEETIPIDEGAEKLFVVRPDDGIPPYRYTWFLAGSLLGGKSSSFNFTPSFETVLHPRLVLEKDLVCTITDSRSSTVSVTWTSVQIHDVNRPPSIVKCSIMVENNSPILLGSTNVLKAQVLGWQDKDGDPESIRYQWQKNGENIDGETDDMFILDTNNNFIIGDQITVVCTPFDGIDEGNPLVSNPVWIVGDWQVTIIPSESSNAALDQVTFGMKNNATDDIDFGIDEDISPQSPESNLADIYFDQNSFSLSRDFRGHSLVAGWTLVVDPRGNTVALTWDRQQIPDGKVLSLYEIDDSGNPLPQNSILMNKTSLLIVNGTSKRFYRLHYADDFRVTFTLWQGWNLCSFPLTPTACAVEDVFSGKTEEAGNEGSFGAGLQGQISGSVWEWESNAYTSATRIEALKGYFVYLKKGTKTILIDGTLVVPDENEDLKVPFSLGWNLYGSITPMTITYPLSAPLQGVIWSWNGRNFEIADILQPFKGYWIHSLEEDALFNLAK